MSVVNIHKIVILYYNNNAALDSNGSNVRFSTSAVASVNFNYTKFSKCCAFLQYLIFILEIDQK